MSVDHRNDSGTAEPSGATRLLLVLPDPRTRAEIAAVLSDAGFAFALAPDVEAGVRHARQEDFPLALVEAEDPGRTSTAVGRLKAARGSMIVVAMANTATAVETVALFRSGAHDVMLSPYDRDAVVRAARRAVELRSRGEQRRKIAEELEHERRRVRELAKRFDPADPFARIVGASSTVAELVRTLREVARTDSTVLVTGESGTGKSMIARSIHEASDRSAGTFVEANCVVYSEGVLHSELFGHEKGAFTGAVRQKRGRFEMARGGTIFLDEIGEIAPSTQLLLLRVLQDRTFERVGGEETLETDARLIAATNRDLEAAMRQGAFRSDLFFRLNVIPIVVPALREHAEDIPTLAQHFLQRATARMGRSHAEFSGDALARLQEHPWPGNIRELENFVERVVVLCRSERVEADELPAPIGGAGEPSRPESNAGATTRVTTTRGTLGEIEKLRIAEALRECGGNKKAAAAKLGIHRSTLYAKIRKHGLDEAPEPATAAHDPYARVG